MAATRGDELAGSLGGATAALGSAFPAGVDPRRSRASERSTSALASSASLRLPPNKRSNNPMAFSHLGFARRLRHEMDAGESPPLGTRSPVTRPLAHSP